MPGDEGKLTVIIAAGATDDDATDEAADGDGRQGRELRDGDCAPQRRSPGHEERRSPRALQAEPRLGAP